MKKTLIVTAAVIERDGKFLITRRDEDKSSPLAWEFAGGKLEPDETPENCAEREVFEETGVRAKAGDIIDAVLYRFEEHNALVLFYGCEISDGEPCPKGCNAVKWILRDEFAAHKFPAEDIAVVEKFLKRKK